METKIIKNVAGTIADFNNKKVFGFVTPVENDFRNPFIGAEGVREEDVPFLKKDTKIIYDWVEDGKGLHAKNVRLAEDE